MTQVVEAITENLKVLHRDDTFQPELAAAGVKLVVVDFFATWCGPCHTIAPVFEQLARKYSKALFVKVDVDKCQETAAANGISAMPTFVFFRNKTKIDTLRGADPGVLEEKIRKWYGSDENEEEEETVVKGHMDLATFIEKSSCECLNEADDHALANALTSHSGFLESDCDEQLIISVTFNQVVKLHSLRINGPKENGPKTVKLFINQPKTLDFDSADTMESVQTLELTADDLVDGAIIPLRFVRFQSVSNIVLFVKDNQNGSDKTQINFLGFIGSPVSATNMADFKRVAGKKGEAH
jgi:thioredoxin